VTAADTSDQIDIFAAALWESTDNVEVRAIHGQSRSSKTLLYTDAADLVWHTSVLAEFNARGWHIYAGINPRRGNRRGDENVTVCRALFTDRERANALVSETIRATVGLPAPTLTINSGHGIHEYWRLAKPVEPALWSEWQKDIAALLGTDPVVFNPERIARLPGILNVKYRPAAECHTRYDRARSHHVTGFLRKIVNEPAWKAHALPAKTATAWRACSVAGAT
jgi:hypothetical protein